MRRSLPLIGLVMLFGCAKAAPDRSEAEQSLRAANAAYDQALIDGDAELLDKIYSDDFRIVDDDADIHDKKNQIDMMTKQVDLLDARSDDLQITLLGPDAALLTGRLTGRYKYRGKESEFTERYTSVWVREDRNWRVKHEHASLKPQETPPPATAG